MVVGSRYAPNGLALAEMTVRTKRSMGRVQEAKDESLCALLIYIHTYIHTPIKIDFGIISRSEVSKK